ncbi:MULTISPECIES: hypothetical protein [unclassified Microcoleus]
MSSLFEYLPSQIQMWTDIRQYIIELRVGAIASPEAGCTCLLNILQ